MFKKNLLTRKTKKVTIPFDKFESQPQGNRNPKLLAPTECYECYNFSVKDGVLKDGYGLQKLKGHNSNGDFPINISCDEVKGVWSSNWLNNFNQDIDDYIFFMTEQNIVQYLELSIEDLILDTTEIFTEVPFLSNVIIANEVAFAFTSPSDNVLLITATRKLVYTDIPKFTNVCYHYDKLFAITSEISNALVYSTEQNITKWTEDNLSRIQFHDDRGRLLKLMSFNDNLYIFREFGITRVSQYSMRSDFEIDHMYQSQCYIYPETIAICGDKVIFLARDGLYEFDGNNVKKMPVPCLDRSQIVFGKPTGIAYNNCYFVALKMDFDGEALDSEKGEFVNNAVLIYDCNSDSVEIMRGIDVNMFAVINSVKNTKLIAIFRGKYKNLIGEFVKNGKFFDDSSIKKWTSGFSDLGYPNKLKHVEEINIKAKADCIVTIKSECGEKSYNVKGKDYSQRIKTDIKGKFFQISFQSMTEQEQEISYANIVMTVYES